MRDPNKERRSRLSTKGSALAPVVLALWLAAGGTFLALSWFVLPEFISALEILEVDLPVATALGIQAASWLCTWPGLCSGLGILAGSLLLYVLGARGTLATWSYGIAALLTILLGCATLLPIYKLDGHLQDGHPAPRLQR